MNNSNTTEAPDTVADNGKAAIPWFSVMINIVYSLEGIVMTAGGLGIAYTIAFHQGLRIQKHYLIVGALMLADGINGIGFLTGGIRRLYLILTFSQWEQINRFTCFLQMPNLFWAIAESPSALLLSVLSIDRLVAVCYPLWHYGQGVNYAMLMTVPPYLVSIFDLTVSFIYTFPGRDDDSFTTYAMCYGDRTRFEWHEMMHVYIMSYSALFSVILLIAVPLGFIARKKKIASPTQSASGYSCPAEKKLQRRLLQSVLLSGACTFLLYVLPTQSPKYLRPYLGKYAYFSELVSVFWVLSNFNPIMNCVIFYTRHKELRIGLKAALKRKKLHADPKQWV